MGKGGCPGAHTGHKLFTPMCKLQQRWNRVRIFDPWPDLTQWLLTRWPNLTRPGHWALWNKITNLTTAW